MNLTAEVSEFISETTYDSIPADVRVRGKRSILDGIGLAVAGSRSSAAAIARREIESYGEMDREATVLGTEAQTPARFAAFLNGLAIHADDFDDTQLAVLPDRVYGLLTHPTAPVLPPVLAIAERDNLNGADTLMAYLIGTEVEMKVAEAISPRHYEEGFHSTATAGAIGSAAASARLVSLDVSRTTMALGIAASQAGGLRENFGTMTKPFHAGRAAESGVLAVSLAATGFTAATNILEARRGFFRAAGGGYDPAAIHGRLGAPWAFANPGVSIKPHPSGSLTHPAMGAFLEMVRANDLQPDDVRSIRVGTNRHMPNALIHHRPTDELAAKFSMEFCLAILLLERRAGLAEFTDEVVNRPDVQQVIRKITFEADPAADEGGFQQMTSLIEVQLTDGRVLRERAEFAEGSPAKPMSDDALVGKFLACLDWAGIGPDVGREAADAIMGLEERASIRDLVRLLRAAQLEAARP